MITSASIIGCPCAVFRRVPVRPGHRQQLHLSQIDEADELLTSDPLALLIGMVLDQPVPEPWSGGIRDRGRPG
jgi:hypothetical protein